MNKYFFNPKDGVIEAFFVINPDAEISDLVDWLGEQDRCDDDPRVELYSVATLCELALGELIDETECWIDPLLVAKIAGALMHFETAVRAFNAIIGHPRLERLTAMSPIEALKACLPSSPKDLT